MGPMCFDAKGVMRLNLPATATAVVLLTFGTDAAALLNDQVEAYVAETVTNDNNVFRISKDRDPRTFLGSDEKSDTFTTTTFGVNLDMPVSRQRLQAGASVNQTRYSRFTDLNYSGRNGRVAWLWQAGDQLSGQLGYSDTAALASFSNFSRRSANALKTQRAYGNASYLLTPSWQLQGGLVSQTLRNGNSARQENDVDLLAADVTANYISAANNKIGLSLRQETARYPTRQVVGGTSVDNAYLQRSLGVVTDWTITGKSHVNARIDQVRRSYDQFGQRNYNGTTFSASYDWKATGTFTLVAVAHRDISLTEDIQTSFVLIKGVSLRPSLDLSEKTKLSGLADYSVRDYLGDPGLTLGVTPSRSDRVRTLGATLSYQALRSLSLQLTGQFETRSSNVALSDYSARVVNLNARLAF